jgi:tyrosyl-tRNA synthetase
MTTPLNPFLHSFQQRGFLYQATDLDGLNAVMTSNIVAGYCGFDCTATSLHVGSLMQIMLLRMLQKHGHKPLVIVGGGTTKIGDPTGKDEARKMLTDADITTNMAGIKSVLEKFITFGDGPSDAIMLNNADWLESIKYIDFLREYGRYFSINRMLGFDSVKTRLEREQNLSFLEFNYMLLQAYDFVHLAQHYNCRIQFGGSDQWGNIVSGIDLNKRLDGKDIFGVTTPLITTSSGVKMGKTEGGAVWLSEEMFSPYQYFQFWRNCEDKDVGRFLRLFTDLEEQEILELEQMEGQQINLAKERLAYAATKICHGAGSADAALDTATKTFKNNELAEGLPTKTISSKELSATIPAFELLLRSEMVESGGAARRMIRAAGAKINDVVIANELQPIGLSDVTTDGVIKLSVGKKKHLLFKVQPED